ncbi:transposase [Paenibacillus sp. CGMCC 1.18879]|uniref:transposase n=1 Tax=Paenibacillus sp. CGMCC 1.18879 TaxID=2834466 RepID=UPI00292DCD22|nr:transposase [Paenibacillus sp. CGMCC 1.18879]
MEDVVPNRFHVHGYVIDSVHEARKTIQHTLSPRVRSYLKANHRLLNPPAESLEEESRTRLEMLLVSKARALHRPCSRQQ